ncbi:MAG: sodium:calcium antiporter [Xanthomonadales bacterium]|nr:sodium:calcium antiporter [Gammaproteobacteria bacterium]MBT8051916.1 sodium:calcium antiporter [Gammaproteobacteria bacterium]MBT8057253.1 sodium:calcium antiporter [Gammaproteobacteria bacterium]NNJ78780.1 sodium:calcium antiporter [Xanthomonadales bacterium]NNL05396.1 sodium:calcium antiporter [Xanthomonadales bacterium]
MDFLLLIAGLVGLWLGTELTIGGALAIARRLRLSEFFVGLVILSIGSDLPELAVAVHAGIKGLAGTDASGVVVGTSIGSVVTQISFVLGVGALLSTLVLPRIFLFKHGAVLLASTVLLFAVCFDGRVSRFEGLGLIVFYAAYVVTLMARNTPSVEHDTVSGGGFSSWALLAVGLSTVILGSDITVNAVVNLARALEVSDVLISVVIIGLGTSLPELSISVSAIVKKRTQMSVGNIIGSNILDTLLPIGIAAMISSVRFDRELLWFDLPFIFVLTTIVLALFLRRGGLQTPQGLILLCLYGIYVTTKLVQF